MNITATNPWYRVNSHYLMTATVSVHRALEHYVAIKQNQPSEVVPEDASDLNAIASSMSAPPALEQLCTTFNLSPFERNILLMCAGIALLPNATALYANAQGNREMPYPTFGLALEVFPNAHWSAFTPQAPLRHWQLLQVGTAQAITLCPLQIDESILHYLLGEPYQDQRLSNAIAPMRVEAYHQAPLQPSHQQIVERITATWSKSNLASAVHIVQLCGIEAADKWAIGATACKLMGRSIKMMFAHRLPLNPDELHLLMQRWEREVALTNSVLLVDCERLNSVDTQLHTAILQLIQDIRTPLIITTQERLHSPERALITYDVPKLTHSEQLAIWQSSLGSSAAELNGHVEALVTQFNLSTPAILAACLKVKGEMHIEQEVENSASQIQNQLWDICRTMARPRLDDLAQHIESTATWKDLVLPEQQRQILKNISAHVRQRAKVYQDWGFAGKSSRGLGISALFSGASGTGKTMAAEMLSQELHLDLYRIDLSAVVSKYIGETEKNLRRIFDAAEAGGAILLFDEADALFGKRSEVKDSHDRHANVEVSYLLQRMEAYQGLAILTTNLKGSLDQAFLRRIRFVISFPFPDAKARAEIWQRIFPSRTPTQELDVDKLGKLNVAGGNIRNIALNAAFLAADAGEPVMMKHILKSAKSEYVKLERSLTDTEIRGWV
ncbi:ATP-binding protein [Allocoleopsis franciscana]|uniref:AAA+ family ATPase n=1 Tax=Allocoleopsis franciscana PCC 7113 TaxID=1173027 RepID=K9WEG4_9CYAN|nr:ATP-binding protein [Allocoleopsis franciscana]AFZ18149.1 AAA+ family ATPase [Allocoleopsis franciscana PCC 7113]